MIKRKKTIAEMVKEFHDAGDIGVSFTRDTLDLRLDLMIEEFKEVAEASGFRHDEEKGLVLTERPKPDQMLKELCDLAYVTVGWALAHGWDFDEAFRRVHASNMTKVSENGKIKKREDGKILKPDTYTPPDLKDLVEKKK